MSIYFLSDLHFSHDKEFLWGQRGFSGVEEMNEKILENIRNAVMPDDDFYILGDLAFGSDFERIEEVVSSLPGKIHLIVGNHDSDAKLAIYRRLPNIVEINYATMLKFGKRSVILSHYPMLTANQEKRPDAAVLNIHGHIHIKETMNEERPYAFNVCCEALNCKPILAEDLMERLIVHNRECWEKTHEDAEVEFE